MSVTIGRSILTRFCGNHLKKLPTRATIVRFASVANDKRSNLEDKAGIPASEANKISAAVLKRVVNPLVIENVELPKISRADEVLIDVQYCALNGSDVLLSKNLYTYEPSLPMVLGYELVGKLIQVGEEAKRQGYQVGDKVVALNKDRYGGLAEQCIAEVSDIWKVPTGMKSLDAVCLLDNYITALVAFERKVNIQEDDMVLINVGISDIGFAAIDLASNVFRAQVISVCATEAAATVARGKGALASLKYKDRTLLNQIQEVAAEKNIKVVFNDADGEYFKKILNCFTKIYKEDATIKDLLRDDSFAVVVHHLSREGRAIIAGTAIMIEPDSDVHKSEFSVSGFNLQTYRKINPEGYRQAGDDVLQFFEDNLITPTYSLIVGLNKVNDAVDLILNKKATGKVIVDIKNKDADVENTKE
ncbi:quinone oxidoreductase-like protein 2 [Calliopsis andreniformis]|uniref:quinone oxidoreductase-like protein 2 n=1 Tax=Calliopsis andreniformis TaxID=337506 RepID=UPI003FCD2864